MSKLRLFLILFGLLICSSGAFAQTYTNLPTFAKTPEHYIQQALNANGANGLIVVDCTVPTYGCSNLGVKLTQLLATSTDSAANTLELFLYNGTETAMLSATAIPAFAGDGVGNPVNLLSLSNIPGIEVDSNGNPELIVTGSMKLEMQVTSAVTSGRQISVFAAGPVF